MAKKAAKHSATTGDKAKTKSNATRSRTLPAYEKRGIYRPDDLALSASKLFPRQSKHWADQASHDGFLRIRPDVMRGIVGLFGSLAVGNPPSPKDVDAWEASKPKGHWDYWSLFDFISVPSEGKKGGLDVVIFHHQNSFQARPLELAFRIHLPKTEAEYFGADQSDDFSEATEAEVLKREWERLRKVLEKRFVSADLKKQKWTVGGKVFDVTYPDD